MAAIAARGLMTLKNAMVMAGIQISSFPSTTSTERPSGALRN